MLRMSNPYRDLERELGYRFGNRALLEQALVHPSYRHEMEGVDADNQRLEFLGDAVLSLLVAAHLYRIAPDLPEGELTPRRSRATSGAALAEVGARIGLGAYLKIGRGESLSGGRSRASNLADAVEALIGAAWLDGGQPAAERIVRKQVLPLLADADTVDNPKGRLQEWAQARWRQSPVYTVLRTDGPAHRACFTVEVCLPDGGRWSGQGSGKRAAEAAAAAAALAALDKALSDG